MSYRRARLRRLVVATISVVLTLTATIQPALAAKPLTAPPSAAPGAEPTGVDGPSIQYEEAQAHAGDQIEFEAGGRVTVGFRPRPGDTWAVGGVSPRALPAGKASGLEIRADGLSGVDSATNDVVIGAESASFTTIEPETAAEPTAATNLRREVFGFLPYWELPDSTTTLDYRVLSTVAYFGVGADKNGNLMKTTSTGATTTGWGGWTSSKMTSVINAAHAAGTRVVLTIQCFAWTSSQKTTQSTLLGSATARTRLAQQIVAAVVARGVDGVNLDFEPIVSGYSDEFTSFVRELRSRLDAAHAGYQLTFDTTGHIGNYPIEAATAAGGADAVLIMGYDYRGASASVTGSIDPLTGPVYDLTDTVAAYTARIAPSKVILGVPYYGRAWSTPDDKPHSKNISGAKYGSSAAVFYADAMDYLGTYGRRWDAIEQAPWTAYQKQVCTTTYGCVTTWRELYVDDAASLKLRYDLVNRTNIRGAGIWALGYDEQRPELYKALADKFLNDTTAPVTGIATLSQTVRDEGFIVSWATWDDSTVTSWDVQVARDGGAWTDWRANTTKTSDVYLGQHTHSYAFRVRGMDSHGNQGAWTVTDPSPSPAPLHVGGFGRVTIDGLAMRASYSTASTKLGELVTGDALRIIGGPVTNDGYTWWQVTGPVDEWATVSAVQVGFWVAATGGPSPYIEPRRPVYATRVDAVLRDYKVAPGIASRTVAPNDPIRDDILLTWTNGVVLSDLHLNVVRADGTLAGSIPFTALGAGPQQYRWTGRIGGTLLPEGTYVLQLEGTASGQALHAPSAQPATSGQLAVFGVTIDLSQGSTLVPVAPVRVLDTGLNLGVTGPFTANNAKKLV
ncbi:MAG: glycosyl hydrolase family 18 protein, partial [Chloroflexi bacterium]|nr:glycosyl hydrolase family 18 protein [Chloroflexota bacterium]